MTTPTDREPGARDDEFIEVDFPEPDSRSDLNIDFSDGNVNYYTSGNQYGTNCCNCDKE